MRIAQINMYQNGSTGNIMRNIAVHARKENLLIDTYSTNAFTYRYHKLPEAPLGHYYYGTYLENMIHYFTGRTIGFNGCFSYFATKRLITNLKKTKIDILHLHNLHGYCINLPVLFRYIKRQNIKVIWTLHDCWSFTGHCPHFEMVECEKWKHGCKKCPQIKSYPASILDDSTFMYKLKKKLFNDVSNMTIVTPSEWLAGQVKKSFLKEYECRVINNGIDLDTFRPIESDFRKKYSCEEKVIILGVASSWGIKKGLDIFARMAGELDEKYQIVLVGTNDIIDKQLPQNIISIHRTENQTELALIYSAADLFVNPTREDTFPTVNMEALACGTPVLTFQTGGSAEIIDKTCGSVVQKDDWDSLINEIVRIGKERPFSEKSCIDRAKHFDENIKYEEYIRLYKSL